jgi:peroxin-4
MSHATASRLLRELRAESKDPNPAIRDLRPLNEDNLRQWRGWLQGIRRTPYQGCLRRPLLTTDGEWLLDIQVPENYPYLPPTIRFITPICHPNVNFQVPAPLRGADLDGGHLS